MSWIRWRGRKTYRIGPRRFTVSFNGLRWPKVTKGWKVWRWSHSERGGHRVNTPGFGWLEIGKRRTRRNRRSRN